MQRAKMIAVRLQSQRAGLDPFDWFDSIDDVIPPKERAEFMAGYKSAAGFAIEGLNKAPQTIPDGARARAA